MAALGTVVGVGREAKATTHWLRPRLRIAAKIADLLIVLELACLPGQDVGARLGNVTAGRERKIEKLWCATTFFG